MKTKTKKSKTKTKSNELRNENAKVAVELANNAKAAVHS